MICLLSSVAYLVSLYADKKCKHITAVTERVLLSMNSTKHMSDNTIMQYPVEFLILM